MKKVKVEELEKVIYQERMSDFIPKNKLLSDIYKASKRLRERSQQGGKA